MNLDDECAQLEDNFRCARHRALEFIKAHNDKLPTECPQCREESHISGLRCPACGYRHAVAWAILRDTEWGYEVVSLNNRTAVLKTFDIE